MDADDEDFVFYGTPIEREEELTSRKRKAAAEAAGQLRSLPLWKQEVRDTEGRRRLHGAFTGGFSAGYYNTVGSKEGWTPQSFTSSRKSRAEVKEQSVYSFLDDDEKAEMEGVLGTSLQFDTFGSTAAELACKHAEKEQSKRPSAIPGPVPDEMILPVANSIGIKLLLKMGWRQGHSIKHSRANSLYEARREARKAFLAFSCDDGRPNNDEHEPVKSTSENVSERSDDDNLLISRSTPVFVLNPKNDLHGLGYDPFKHAPEFEDRKRLQVYGDKKSRNAVSNFFASRSGKVAPGFGIGALEEYDIEDEDVYASSSGFEFEETYVEENEEPSIASGHRKQILSKKEQGVLSGFKVASSNSDYQLERFNPPVIPPDFEPHHKFPTPIENKNDFADLHLLEVSPPEDGTLRLLIEGFASLVARGGDLFENISKEKHKNNPLFSFLSGGNGSDFYKRKLWEEKQKRVGQRKQQLDLKPSNSMQKMSAECRGRILGERPLERSSKDIDSSSSSKEVAHLQYNLSDTFTKPASLLESLEAAKPYKNDPAKQERFEQFLKDKYQGGLRSLYSGGNSYMSEADRARERLDFEAAAETIEKTKSSTAVTSASQHLMDIMATGSGQFVPGGIEQNRIAQSEEMIEKNYPRREEFQWRPAPVLCKRFDIIDPFMGKPPPMPRARSKMDSLIIMPDFVKTTNNEDTADVQQSLPVSQPEMEDANNQSSGTELLNESKNISVERPVDLYKAIFSDDSDDEEAPNGSQLDNIERKNDITNTTLNRLIAGDFLESLGKELGLEVPQDGRYCIDNTKSSDYQKDAINMDGIKKLSRNDLSPSVKASAEFSADVDACGGKFVVSSTSRIGEELHDKKDALTGRNPIVDVEAMNASGSKTSGGKGNLVCTLTDGIDGRSYRKVSSKDAGKRSKSRQNRSMSSSDSDSSHGHECRDHSSRRKSRKHSKHHYHKTKESTHRASHHRSSRDQEEHRKEKKKSRDRERDYRHSKSDTQRKHR